MLSTAYYPHRVAVPLHKLVGQFVLGRSDVPLPEGWTSLELNGWHLSRHEALPVHRVLLEGTGACIGWVLGSVVTREGVLAAGSVRIEQMKDWDATLDWLLGGLIGRFLVIAISGGPPRAYPDSFGMQAAVFAREAELLASTSALIPASKGTPFNLENILATDIPYNNSMYPMGLTPRDGIERVRPNHYLDLVRWSLVRRWPLGDVPEDADPEKVVNRVAHLAQRAVEALGAVYPLQCPVTAGRDTRVLIACTRRISDRTKYFTAEFPGHLSSWRDVHTAANIAKRHHLNYELLPRRKARKSDLMEWVQRTSGEAGELTGWTGFRTLKQGARDRATLLGWGQDVARPVYWKNVAAGYQMTPSDVLQLCGVPELPHFVKRAKDWLDELPARRTESVYDLYLTEQRGGCWTGVIEYAEDGYSRERLGPMCNEEIVRALMCMPREYRVKWLFERQVISLLWPELLEHPFNDELKVSRPRTTYFNARTKAALVVARLHRISRRERMQPGWLKSKITSRF